eukprot:4850636-Pleurochrysis_carterae.AAC.3
MENRRCSLDPRVSVCMVRASRVGTRRRAVRPQGDAQSESAAAAGGLLRPSAELQEVLLSLWDIIKSSARVQVRALAWQEFKYVLNEKLVLEQMIGMPQIAQLVLQRRRHCHTHGHVQQRAHGSTHAYARGGRGHRGSGAYRGASSTKRDRGGITLLRAC